MVSCNPERKMKKRRSGVDTELAPKSEERSDFHLPLRLFSSRLYRRVHILIAGRVPGHLSFIRNASLTFRRARVRLGNGSASQREPVRLSTEEQGAPWF